MSSYKFQTPANTGPASNLLPPGDHPFVVVECEPPHVNEKSGNLVCAVKLSMQPGGQTVFASPWQGVDRNGNARDDIALFLLAINRAPHPGAEPDWDGCVGAKGKAKIKVEDDLNGIPRNKVAFFFTPKQASPAAPSATPFDKARGQASPPIKFNDPDLDVAPDDIPF
jgi:hypothetical protein